MKLGLLLLLAAHPALAAEALVDRVVAVVDGEAILASDLIPAQAQGLSQKEAFERLIRDRLLTAEARARGLEVSETELEAALDRVQERNKIPDRARLQDAVISSGQDWNEYQDALRRQLVQQRLIGSIMRQGSMVTDREIDNELSLRGSSYREERQLRHILLRLDERSPNWQIQDAQQRLATLASQIQSEAAFAEAAKANSEDGSAGQGGALGWVRRGQMVPAFETAAFAAPVDTVVGPVRSRFGLHLIWLSGSRQRSVDKSLRQAVAEQLRQKKAEAALERLIEGARERALVRRIP